MSSSKAIEFLELVGVKLTPHQDRIMRRASKVFEYAEVAEQEIKRAAEKHPGKAPEINRAFPLLMPGPFVDLHKDVYRGHARELLGRVARGEDTRPGTKAEVLMALSEASLRAPLRRDATELACRLTADLMPGVSRDDLLPKRRARETHKGALKELLHQFRRQLAKHDRVVDS